jgi:hypothetical protein
MSNFDPIDSQNNLGSAPVLETSADEKPIDWEYLKKQEAVLDEYLQDEMKNYQNVNFVYV